MEGVPHHGVLLKAFWKNKLFLCKFYSFRFDGRGVRRTPLPSKRKLKFLVILLQTHQKIMLDPKENSSNFAVFLKGRDAKSQIFLAAYRPGEVFPTLSTIFDCREFFEFTVTT